MRKYTIVPLPTGVFEGITPLSRMCFGFIWDRYRVSCYNVSGGHDAWYDYDWDETFCVFSHRELSEQVGASERTIRRCLDELRRAQLIETKRCEYQGACRFFIPEDVRAYMRPVGSVSQGET